MSRPALVSQKILRVLAEKHYASASQIVSELSKEQSVNKTSVYRALEKMEAENKVCRHLFQNDQVVYEARTHHHDHLVCENCGVVEAVHCEEHLEGETVKGFVISHHHKTLFGLCPACQAVS